MTLERRPRDLDPASSTLGTSLLMVDDPTWPYARSLSKDKWHAEFNGDDQLQTFIANNSEPSAQIGKLTLFFDGTSLKAKLPDGSVAILTQLGVGLYQSHDPTLDAFAVAASGPDLLPYFSGIDQVSNTPLTPFARTLLDDADAPTARGTLGLGTAAAKNVAASGDAAAGEVVLGSDSRLGGASEPTLAGLAALTVSAADKMIYSTGVETFGLTTLSAFARTFLDDADAATVRGTLGLGTAAVKGAPASGNAASNEVVLGSDTRLSGWQAADATLTGLAALSTAADQLIYSTASDVFAMANLSAFIRTLIDDVDAATARGTLGLAALAILASVDTAQINNSAVTYAKMQNVSATDKLLGRSTAGAGVVEEIACTSFIRTLLDDAAASNARTTLGLGSLATLSTVGTTELTAAGVTYAKIQNVSATDKLLGRSTAGAGSVEEIACTSFARSFLDDADAATVRTTLGLGTAAVVNTGTGSTNAILGNDSRLTDARASTFASLSDSYTANSGLNTAIAAKQDLDATLTALAGLATGANKLPYSTGTDTFAQADLTAFGRSQIDDADASAGRTTLGLGGAAVLNVGSTAGTVAAGDDTRLSDARALASGGTVPSHFFTEQTAVTSTPRTLTTTDSGTVLPMNAASGVVTIPTYSGSYKGFACEVYAVQATTINGTTSGTTILAAGESAYVRAVNSSWKVSKIAPTAFV